MPIVIDEVVISVEVAPPASASTPPSLSSPEQRQTIVSECVERVLEILQQKAER